MNTARTRHGFTLVEVLVVIGIIGILIAILLPSLRRARESANSAACLSNLRQIALAMTIYSADNHGQMVPKDYFDAKNPAALPGNWVGILVDGKYLNALDQPDFKSTTSRGTSVLRCPSGLDTRWNLLTPGYPGGQYSADGTKFWRQQSSISKKYYDTWYAVNADNTTFGVYPMNIVPIPGQTVPQLMKLSRIKRADQVPLVFDGLQHHYGGGWGFTHINARHNFGRTTNVVFCDGHCSSLDRKLMPDEFDEMADPTTLRQKHGYPIWRLDE
jgi:prepilin-type N-terminal cleavage/methylation domain-containing protein/prepilin-type processing-associated H-X9-DG protein